MTTPRTAPTIRTSFTAQPNSNFFSALRKSNRPFSATPIQLTLIQTNTTNDSHHRSYIHLQINANDLKRPRRGDEQRICEPSIFITDDETVQPKSRQYRPINPIHYETTENRLQTQAALYEHLVTANPLGRRITPEQTVIEFKQVNAARIVQNLNIDLDDLNNANPLNKDAMVPEVINKTTKAMGDIAAHVILVDAVKSSVIKEYRQLQNQQRI